MLKTNKSEENYHELCCSSSHSPRPSPFSLVRGSKWLPGIRMWSSRKSLLEGGLSLRFQSVAVNMWAHCGPRKGSRRLRTYIWTLSSFIVVEEIVEMLKHLQYTQYTQFYSSISPTYGFNYSRYEVYASLHYHKRRLKK